jgi:hypothetical protein
MRRGGPRRRGPRGWSATCAAGLAALALAACETSDAPRTSEAPTVRPEQPRPAPAPAPAPPPGPSAESLAAAAGYARAERRLLAQGLLRTDGGGIDARFDAEDLARNFERIALFSEYVQVSGRYVAQQSRAQLRRWEEPVRMQLHFGASVDAETRARDTRTVRSFAARLQRLTGHPVRLVGSGGNYHVFVVSVDEQAALAPKLDALGLGLSRATIGEITSLPRTAYCAVYASSKVARPNAYVSAIALIRSEHPDLMRLSCYHEELAQGMGLPNDSPRARPSIFNDDEEFALLTAQDELLLRMLYDPALSPGMTPAEARPVIRALADGLMGGPS